MSEHQPEFTPEQIDQWAETLAKKDDDYMAEVEVKPQKNFWTKNVPGLEKILTSRQSVARYSMSERNAKEISELYAESLRQEGKDAIAKPRRREEGDRLTF